MITEEERGELVRHRLRRAEETLDEAELLLKADKLPGAVNRVVPARGCGASGGNFIEGGAAPAPQRRQRMNLILCFNRC
jgi:hypothetical protein